MKPPSGKDKANTHHFRMGPLTKMAGSSSKNLVTSVPTCIKEINETSDYR